MAQLGIVHHPIFQEHDPGSYHPESPRRLAALEEVLAGPARGLFEEIEPRPASREEVCWVHQPDYYQQMEATAGRAQTRLDPDTSTSARSFEAALMAAGGVTALVEAAHQGQIEAGLALVRPPGHHAEANRGMGFCLFNNVAVAACYGLHRLGYSRILIVDWDLHHGNGTQHTFEDEARVVYFSTHQYPYYPGTGGAYETGRGRAEGRTINVPLGMGNGDEEYIHIFSRILKPVTQEFKPELILVSAGFDIYFGDPLGGQLVSPRVFAALARLLDELAGQLCPGQLVFTLEGGYHIQGQAESILAIIKELSGSGKLEKDELRDNTKGPDIPVVAAVKEIQGQYWSCFKE